jgi:hypothetical protein
MANSTAARATALSASVDISSFGRNQRARRTALFVLGMHRSGTSALTRVLGLCGGALPQQGAQELHESNALGHWEPKRIVETHDRFLAEAGTAWDDQAPYPDAMFETERAESCRRRLILLARRAYGDAPLFILKDPRASRLMRLWSPVVTALDSAPRAVIMLRNPLEVAASLQRREGWDEHRALVVWMRYMLSAERDTRAMPRCFIHYDHLMEDWRSAVGKVSEALGIPLAPSGREIDRFVRQELRHHRRPAAEFFLRGDIADCVKETYRCLDAAMETGTVDTAALDAISEALDAAELVYRETSASASSARARAVFIERQISPQRRDALFALAMAEVGRLRNCAEQSEQQLQTVLKTRSWRFTRPLRGASYLVRRLIRTAFRSGPALSSIKPAGH